MSSTPTLVLSLLKGSINDDIALDIIPPQDVVCSRCNFGGADVRFVSCGCCVHSRCLNLCDRPVTQCPRCPNMPFTGLSLLPMSFTDLDKARASAASQNISKKGKKRKETCAPIFEEADGNCRTGRWTPEEINFCDQLIKFFQSGDLPLLDGIKLNDFLAAMLNSKQSRLTKKMKNANLSGKVFQRSHGYISNLDEAKAFSEIELAFLRSVADPLEQAQIRFYMQKEWREMISSYCASISQPLDADAWLSSVEEMERRESSAKDAARMTRRKLMMGIALDQDILNPDQGVFIEKSSPFVSGLYDSFLDNDDLLNLFNDKPSGKTVDPKAGQRHYWHYSSPFLGKVISYIQRHACPFEHVDIWVPSFVPDSDASEGSGNNVSTCRLCFAGSATADLKVPANGVGPSETIDSDEQFNLLSFGDYSQKFSFNVGCGLPGRVYESGVPAWEQSVQNAPLTHFERNGGAQQWGIKTVVGIPIPSPNVGRIVVVLYSRYDRQKDPDMVGRLYEEFKKLIPSPKWKLIVDIGKGPEVSNPPSSDEMFASSLTSDLDRKENNMSSYNQQNTQQIPNQSISNGKVLPPNSQVNDKAERIRELVAVLGNHMPQEESSSQMKFLQSFMALRLMLLKPSRTQHEKEMEETLLSSYDSYIATGRSQADIAVMIVRDYVFLQQLHQPQSSLNSSAQYNHQSATHHQMQQLEIPSMQHQEGPPHQYNFQNPQQDTLDAPSNANGFFHQAPLASNNIQPRGTIPDVSNHSYNLNLGGAPSFDSTLKKTP